MTYLIVGLKNEHGLYKIHTEVSPTQLVGTELLRNIMPIFDACTGHEPDTFLIHEVFENEKKKGGLMNKEPSLEPMESSIIREALYLLTPQLP